MVGKGKDEISPLRDASHRSGRDDGSEVKGNDLKIKAKVKSVTSRANSKSSSKKAPCLLRGCFKGCKVIYARYKGKEYKAWVQSNGRIRR